MPNFSNPLTDPQAAAAARRLFRALPGRVHLIAVESDQQRENRFERDAKLKRDLWRSQVLRSR